ncbi:uncharacterized protein MELLADRAFT_61025 [Melampsora larici-populina 98AG31]|uniref:Uncharacterized protein n=1 Tax=Melampsora larici-populina (strain 98AG31 / pathotype 3-4-7) TaxID=747676 RepID=F4RDB3_MELLP|nr:uncharacterized protein MELLADRAFT_61025 [Melampsora larici-populina 98AG31]EGG09371.1 hypothetical protein MELLADRAFT_61025 [Melampsora larici-populina 98AG31]
MDVDDSSDQNESVAMDWSRVIDIDNSQSSKSRRSSSNMERTSQVWPLPSGSEQGSLHDGVAPSVSSSGACEIFARGQQIPSSSPSLAFQQPLPADISNKRGRARTRSQSTNDKWPKIGASMGNLDSNLESHGEQSLVPDGSMFSEELDYHPMLRSDVQGPSSAEPSSRRLELRRSNRIQSQSGQSRLASNVAPIPVKLQQKPSESRKQSNTNTTIRTLAASSKKAKVKKTASSSAPQPQTPKETAAEPADIDKTMTQAFTRRGLFKAVLKGCPTYLRRVDEKIRGEVIKALTATPTTKWSAETNLDRDAYESWLSYLNTRLNQRYGTFSDGCSFSMGSPSLPTKVEITKLLKVFGKNYTSYQHVKGRGNSAIEYWIQGEHHYGYIQYAFRTKLVPTIFLVVNQFTKLNTRDSIHDCFVSHPRLQAARVYSKIERSVIVDLHDLMGHIIVLSHPPGHLGIAQETLGIVGLRNVSSITTDTSLE